MKIINYNSIVNIYFEIMDKEYFGLNKHQAAKIIGCRPRTLKSYRAQGLLQEGIHWFRINCRRITYNSYLLQDWVVNRYNWIQHEKAIENFLISLPSYEN